ncbi:type I-E CRISPR-associated endonuclease Cas1e [Candidatus Foliamicus sp.]
MLGGRLGLETARIPHADRAGLLWLSRGALTARDGTLSFERGKEFAVNDPLSAGRYAVPFQGVSMILLGPGSTVSHDALRLLARHGTALAAVGVDGVRQYTAPPLISDRSGLARKQAIAWANEKQRLDIARKMYAWRLGRVLPHRDIAVLRGIEGARMKETYRLVAAQVGIQWRGRRYDRSRPSSSDLPNQALNHCSSAVEAAAAIAVSATATIPQLGFIHEDPGQSFVLDIADLFRDTITIPVAFRAAKQAGSPPFENIERLARREVGKALARDKSIPKMIERIKQLFTDKEQEPPRL